MKTKKIIALWMVFCMVLSGCASSQTDGEENAAPAATEDFGTVDAGQLNDIRIITPLSDTTMENLTDAVLSVSLDEGDAYVDDTGIMRMNLKIYTYDKFGMVDIAALEVGDILARHSGEAEVLSIEEDEWGRLCINGGLENDGFDLTTDDCGTFYEIGFNDTKNWYQIGEAVLRVSVDFIGIDHADLELGEVIIYPGDFLVGAVKNYDFTPYNTTIRVENGQIVEMHRAYTP